jgi:hypothetical protein
MLAARGFWGMVDYHFLVQELLGGKQYQDIGIDEASQVIADIWLNGMLPRTDPGEPDPGGSNGKDVRENRPKTLSPPRTQKTRKHTE